MKKRKYWVRTADGRKACYEAHESIRFEVLVAMIELELGSPVICCLGVVH